METGRNNNSVHFPPEAVFPEAAFPEVNRFASIPLNLDIVTTLNSVLCGSATCSVPQVGGWGWGQKSFEHTVIVPEHCFIKLKDT